jgi:glycine/D-amino acid oxidase-like deaminating enzyme
MGSKPVRIAIIGGGVTGTSTANQLVSLCKNQELKVVIFDQGGLYMYVYVFICICI